MRRLTYAVFATLLCLPFLAVGVAIAAAMQQPVLRSALLVAWGIPTIAFGFFVLPRLWKRWFGDEVPPPGRRELRVEDAARRVRSALYVVVPIVVGVIWLVQRFR